MDAPRIRGQAVRLVDSSPANAEFDRDRGAAPIFTPLELGASVGADTHTQERDRLVQATLPARHTLPEGCRRCGAMRCNAVQCDDDMPTPSESDRRFIGVSTYFCCGYGHGIAVEG